MSSGKLLKKRNSTIDYGMGNPSKYTGHWTVAGTIKKTLTDKAAIFNAMQSWADQLRQKGLDVELS
jgi:hypothetical protein